MKQTNALTIVKVWPVYLMEVGGIQKKTDARL